MGERPVGFDTDGDAAGGALIGSRSTRSMTVCRKSRVSVIAAYRFVVGVVPRLVAGLRAQYSACSSLARATSRPDIERHCLDGFAT